MGTKQTMKADKEQLIRFFTSVGDPGDDSMRIFLYGPDICLSEYTSLLRPKNNTLAMIFVELYVEGRKWEPMGINTLRGKKMRFVSFDQEDKVATVAIYISRHEFHEADRMHKNLYISKLLLSAFDLVAEKLKKKGVEYPFEESRIELEHTLNKFANQSGKLD